MDTFKVGDTVEATGWIKRMDGRSQIAPGGRARVGRVHEGKVYQDLLLYPERGGLPIAMLVTEYTPIKKVA